MSDLTKRLPVELWYYTFGYLHLGHIVHFSATCKFSAKLAHRFILFRRRHLAARFFCELDILFRLLYTCQAVISGSAALYVLQPLLATSWIPNDLDIYVSQNNLRLLLAALAIEGYHDVLTSAPHVKHYSCRHLHTTITLTCSHQTIEVIVSKDACSAISPIYLFHSTLLMNFLTHDAMCCSYPRLTLRGLSLIHPHFAHDTILNRASIDALLKYHC